MLENCAEACGLCGPSPCFGAGKCADGLAPCADWAARGECVANAVFMAGKCAGACGLCRPATAASRPQGEAAASAAAPLGATRPPARYEFSPQPLLGNRHELVLQRLDPPVGFRRKCAYDNWAYSLVDAIVRRATKKSLLHWTGELVLRPLGAEDALACTGLATAADCSRAARGRLPNGRRLRATGCLSERWCYAQAPSQVEGALGLWERWAPPRPYTRVQVSNSLFGSARDMGRLSLMLLNGGELDGVRILSTESVGLLLGSARAQATAGPLPMECMGMSSFALGLGWCSDRTPMGATEAARRHHGTDECRAPDWFGWAGSFGSRYAFMRTDSRRHNETTGGGVYCAQSSNIPLLPGGRNECRRHHAVAHALVEAMRAIWPQPGGAGPEECHAMPHGAARRRVAL